LTRLVTRIAGCIFSLAVEMTREVYEREVTIY
jgi:hypothetical protein